MSKNKLFYNTTYSEGTFDDIKIPNFSWIKIDLQEIKNVTTDKDGAVQKSVLDFKININMDGKLNIEDKELSKKIQEICLLNFPPYYWKEKSYKFYTTERTGDINLKKKIILNLFSLLTQYEHDKELQFNESSKFFEEDAKNNITYETPDLYMKFHEPTKRFVVLAKDFLGSEKFKLLKSASEYSSQLVNKEDISSQNQNRFLLDTSFFEKDLPGKKINKKTYFFINPSSYEEIKKHFIEEQKLMASFIEEQKQISKKINLSDYNIDEENIFDLKIKFDENLQCFSFYGKGYFDSSSYYGMKTKRSLLALWALNFIYSEDKKDINTYASDEIMIENKDKIYLQEIKGGSKKDKDVHIPASEWEKIAKIKENYEKEKIFWSKGTKEIKISHRDFSCENIFERFPAVYIDSKGKCFFAFSSRRTGVFKSVATSTLDHNPWVYDCDQGDSFANEDVKKKRNTKFTQTLKTIPITYSQAKYFIEDHPFAQHIKRGSTLLNGIVHSSQENNYLISQEDKIKNFETVLLMAEIYSKAEEIDGLKQKSKKMKI